MSDEQARKTLQELASRLNINLDDVLAHVNSVDIDASPAAAVPDITLSDGAIRAAICDSYSASESWAANLDRTVLQRSHLIMIDGRRRLRLSDEARGAILRAASTDQRRLNALIDEADARSAAGGAKPDTDARSTELRRLIKGDTKDLAGASPAELRAVVAALKLLRDTQLPAGVPSLSDAQRLLERAELLEPLRMTIGATGSWHAVPEADRFVGRETQLRELRGFVDEMKSQGKLESIHRNMRAATRAIRKELGDHTVEGVRMIVAQGGVGKSALIAKFVLDHALLQENPFPFAYLDFDRASIQARDPRQLLAEVVRQVALQFPKPAPELLGLRDQIKHSLSAISQRSVDADPFEDFRRIVRQQITHERRAMLIVFDTVEIVQCDALAMKGLLAFMDRMSQGGFTELRLVAAGRAHVQELLDKTEVRAEGVVIPLGPLSVEEAIQMVRRLGDSLLPGAWREEWTSRLAGSKTDHPERREPLSLRVAVETIRDEEPANRDRQSLRIEELGEDGANFVGKLYMNRVVGHVTGGEEVRRLAWPGLVMRRVTPEIIRYALAPHLNINPNAADTLFHALAGQLWIVSRDGDVLTHQPDLRARTLPLMRQRPEFTDINAAAIRYYAERRDASARDRAEWIYHRLLGGEAVQTVDPDFNDGLIPFLKQAAIDFPPRSPAADYLSARTSDHLQSDDLLARIDPQLALMHVARVGATKGSLGDTSLDRLLLNLPLDAVAGPLPPDADAASICLFVKTGRWVFRAPASTATQGVWREQAATALAYRRARTAAADPSSAIQELEHAYAASTVEMVPAGVLIQDLACARVTSWAGADKIDYLIRRSLSRGVSATDSTIGSAVLRTAMAFGHHSVAIAARLWGMQAAETVRATSTSAVSARELNALLPDPVLEAAARAVVVAAGRTWESYLEQTRQETDHTRLGDTTLSLAVIDAVLRRAEHGATPDLDCLRRFASARDEDWLVPMGYAAYRATNGKVPSRISDLFDTYQPRELGFIARSMRRRVPIPTDIIAVLRTADEASDIANACRLFLEEGDSTKADDLKRLLSYHAGWRGSISKHIVRQNEAQP